MKTAFVHLALISAVLATRRPPTHEETKQAAKYIPNAYIVELSEGSAAKRSSSSPHEDAYHAMRARGIPFNTVSEYDAPGIFTGASIRLTSPGDVARLAALPGVESIRPVIKIDMPKPLNPLVVDSPSADLPDTYSTHVMTGVDKAHAMGYTGEGVKIGIIDTGIDYKHSLLGGNIGKGFKVIGGYDFVGDAFNGQNELKPDDDPLDECNGHGTHVAGIIGASGNNSFNIIGVAPKASLSAYRIFGCTGFTGDDLIVAALIRAYNEKQDVITLSLGGASGWTEGTASVVASRIAAQGRVLTIAAGNDGTEGAWYTSDPGSGQGAISVASVDNIVSQVQNLFVHGADHDPIPYFEPLPLNATGEYPIWATSTDTTKADDACAPLPDSTPDLSKYVVVVHRGTCTFVQKLANIAAKNGTLSLIYNSDTGAFSAIATGPYKAVLIPADAGKYLVQQFVTNPNITVSFPQTGGASTIPNPSGGLTSVFSTIGPTFDMHMSPAVAAPGGNILSTLPKESYGVESGTSMATPFVAGAAALILEARGHSRDVALDVQRMLQATAGDVAASHTDGTPLRTVAQQGAGLIQVDRAIALKTVVSPAQIALNDTVHMKPNHTISITNHGDEAQVYKIQHLPAETINTMDASDGFVNLIPASVPGAATVLLSAKKVTVQPGETHHFIATFIPPTGQNTSLPIYSGFIHIDSATESFKVTYFGVAASLKDVRVLDTTDEFFGIPLPTVLNLDGTVQSDPRNYTFLGRDFPFLLLRFAFGTAKLRIDLVDKDFELPSSGSYNKVKTIGPLSGLDYLPRSNSNPFSGYTALDFLGTYTNGTRIDDGQYRALLRVLKVLGSRNKEEDYEAWLSPQFGVVTPP
ncbi:Subtilisin-like protease [Mycena kentingensis (nom. inval.)]|nr:Subtilisin-like protease [Mycena kentingensis (nom. inval.)]